MGFGVIWRVPGEAPVIRCEAVGWGLSPFYDWRRFYEAAVVETDCRRLPVLIRVARAAIDAGMAQINEDHRAPAESCRHPRMPSQACASSSTKPTRIESLLLPLAPTRTWDICDWRFDSRPPFAAILH